MAEHVVFWPCGPGNPGGRRPATCTAGSGGCQIRPAAAELFLASAYLFRHHDGRPFCRPHDAPPRREILAAAEAITSAGESALPVAAARGAMASRKVALRHFLK